MKTGGHRTWGCLAAARPSRWWYAPFALAATGCWAYGCGQAPPARPPPPAYGSPYAPVAYPYGPPPGGYPPSQPLPYAVAQFAQAESARRNSVRATPPPPAPNVFEPINLAALANVARMFPRGCAPFQAAPGVYVHLDCRRYEPIAGARPVDPGSLLRLFQAGQLRLDPQVLGAVAPPSLLTGLESLMGGSAPSATASALASSPRQLPASVDHRLLGTEGPVKDQQLVGSCTAFSLSSVMDNAIRRLNQADVVSAMHVWSRYADPTMASAESHNEGRPLTLWGDYPYDERVACRMEAQDDGCAELLMPPVQVGTAANDPTVQAQIRAADAAGRYTITEVDQINPIDPDALALDLATGKDVWFALGVGQDAWTSPEVQSTGVVPDWSIEDGGHAVALAGYRTTGAGRQFLVHNSWGPSWGDGGYGWISEAMIRAHAQYAYTIKLVDRAAPSPPPTPVPTPPPQPGGAPGCPAGYTTLLGLPLCHKACTTAADCGPGGTCVSMMPTGGLTTCAPSNPLTDDDCGAGELVDIVTGRCAPACANGLRPASGWCPFGAAAR